MTFCFVRSLVDMGQPGEGCEDEQKLGVLQKEGRQGTGGFQVDREETWVCTITSFSPLKGQIQRP